MSASQISTAQLSLLKACLVPAEEVEPHWRDWRGRIDLEHLDEGSNRLLPLLYRRLEAAGLHDPEMARLRGIYRYHWCRNQLLLAELRRLLAALHDLGVEVLLLKGAALIHRYYHDPGIRPMSDLDIMVRPADMKAVFKLLRERGWQARVQADLDQMQTRRLIHAVDFRRDWNGRGLEIDVHWTPLHRSTWPGAEEAFWVRSLATSVDGLPCRVLEPTDQLLHTCLHGGAWNAMPPLRWVTDACCILRGDAEAIDWERLIEDAHRHHGFLMLRAALGYLHEAFAAPVPEAPMRQLAMNRPSRAERLEHQLQTHQIAAARLDQLLLLEWFNHSRAYQRAGMLARLADFPAYLKLSWKLDHWHQVPGFVIRRLAARLTGKAYSSR
ncbi:nucleotidyltransferase family protein [Ottowia sp. VDI28]|uniref:nucleotidyltransferase family protein n=1 Tax=Ottowia sp. VDI28 TaxID=3133968 RepID=UPI003C2C0785